SHKKLRLAAFTGFPGWSQTWRDTDVHALDSLDVDYYIKFAKLAEEGKFDTLFSRMEHHFPAALLPNICRVSVHLSQQLYSQLSPHIRNTLGWFTLLAPVDNEPTHVARQLASLDHISHGRAGWNVVTTPGPGARNLGIPVEDGKAKYKRAAAFHDAAGTSPEGMALGGAIADFVYCANYSIADGQKIYNSLKSYATAAGRYPDHLLVMTGVVVIWGETHEEAERKFEKAISAWPIDVAVQSLAFDFKGFDLDDLFPDTSEQDVRSKGRAVAITSYARSNGLTIRQAAQHCSVGLGHRPLVGTTQSIADDLQAWLDAEATDGFVIQPLHIKGLQEFNEHIVPELVRRGIYRSEYEGKTLRENLGVPRPPNRYVQ
ncbi:unnamed protein product, partial [Aureobasidium pullulans]